MFKKEGHNLRRTYAQMMHDNLKLVHGKDIENYKYFPKFLGTCLSRLEQMDAMSTEYLSEKLREFNSLEIKRSHVPQTLRTLRADIHCDNWDKTT